MTEDKNCFGTKQYAENSGICKRCELYLDCGKSRLNKNRIKMKGGKNGKENI